MERTAHVRPKAGKWTLGKGTMEKEIMEGQLTKLNFKVKFAVMEMSTG